MPRFQCGLKLARINVIVFNGIARLKHGGALETWNGLQDRDLHILWQRGRDTIRINGWIVQPFRLQENLVPVTVAELDHLVLDRRAVARSHAFDRTRIHGRAAKIGPNQIVRLRRRPRYAALDLRIDDCVGHQRERNRMLVRRLHVQ